MTTVVPSGLTAMSLGKSPATAYPTSWSDLPAAATTARFEVAPFGVETVGICDHDGLVVIDEGQSHGSLADLDSVDQRRRRM